MMLVVYDISKGLPDVIGTIEFPSSLIDLSINTKDAHLRDILLVATMNPIAGDIVVGDVGYEIALVQHLKECGYIVDKHLPGQHDQKTHGRSQGGAEDLQSLSADELRAKGYIAVFRGAGPRGLEQIRPSESGQLGPGIYFYDSPIQARSYAGVGGGIITGFVPKDSVVMLDIPGGVFSTPHRVVVLQDLALFVRRGNIPVEDTLGDLDVLNAKAEQALEHAGT